VARENGRDGISPMKHGQGSGGWTRFWLGAAGAVIQQIGLAIISVAFPRITSMRNKGLQDNKEFIR